MASAAKNSTPWLNSNKGTKCDIEICDSRALFKSSNARLLSPGPLQHPYPLACLHLYLSQKLEEIKDTTEREAFLDALAHGSPTAWRHFNLLGEYDFVEEKLRDGMGIRLPKLMN